MIELIDEAPSSAMNLRRPLPPERLDTLSREILEGGIAPGASFSETRRAVMWALRRLPGTRIEPDCERGP